MGAVYEAKDERLDSIVALKETFFSQEELRKAFEREAKLLARLHHRALPVVSDHFSDDQGQFLVMQFIPGKNLEQLLALNGGSFQMEQVLRWADGLLDALEYLHTQEPPVIHRDIKPANIKLTEAGNIFLLDFGLAKGHRSLSEMTTGAGSIMAFTLSYAPLEQIQGTGTDPQSDLFAFGATIYHLLTGKAPVDALTRAMTIVGENPDPLQLASEINPMVPLPIAEILHQALSLKAANRPASARDLRRHLRLAAQSLNLYNFPYDDRPQPASMRLFVPSSSTGGQEVSPVAVTKAGNKTAEGLSTAETVFDSLAPLARQSDGLTSARPTGAAAVPVQPTAPPVSSNTRSMTRWWKNVPRSWLIGIGVLVVAGGLGLRMMGPPPPRPALPPGATEFHRSGQATVTDPSTIVQKSELEMAGKVLRRLESDYPLGARWFGRKGDVVVDVLISEDGLVEMARPLSGPPHLYQPAVNAAAEWEFQPTLQNGKPVKVSTTITFQYR